jgi:flagellar hook capping protein FlgD
VDGYARSALNYMDQVYDYIIPVVWSTWEMEESPGAAERFDLLYSGEITPTAYWGGTHSFSEGECNSYNYELAYTEIIEEESPLEIDVTIDMSRAETFDVSATIEVTDEISTADNKLFFVITNWTEYSTENPWYYLVVAKSDEIDLELANIGDTATYNATLSVTMEPDWYLEDLHAVAIVQSFDNRQVLQAAQMKFQETGINDPTTPPVISILGQNYPNPFNPTTTIGYNLTERSSVELDVYNQRGQKVKTLVNSTKDAGAHNVVWNGTDQRGKAVPSGVYLYRIYSDSPEGGRYTSVKKMILLK